MATAVELKRRMKGAADNATTAAVACMTNQARATRGAERARAPGSRARQWRTSLAWVRGVHGIGRKRHSIDGAPKTAGIGTPVVGSACISEGPCILTRAGIALEEPCIVTRAGIALEETRIVTRAGIALEKTRIVTCVTRALGFGACATDEDENEWGDQLAAHFEIHQGDPNDRRCS